MTVYRRGLTRQPRTRFERWWRRQGSWLLAAVVLLALYVSVIVLYGYEFMAIGARF